MHFRFLHALQLPTPLVNFLSFLFFSFLIVYFFPFLLFLYLSFLVLFIGSLYFLSLSFLFLFFVFCSTYQHTFTREKVLVRKMFHRKGRTYFHDTKPFSLTFSLFFQMLYLLSISWNRFSVMCICSAIDHRWLKNVVKTKKKWHLGRSRLCHWCPYNIPTSSVFYYRLYRSMVKWNLFVLYWNKHDVVNGDMAFVSTLQ